MSGGRDGDGDGGRDAPASHRRRRETRARETRIPRALGRLLPEQRGPAHCSSRGSGWSCPGHDVVITGLGRSSRRLGAVVADVAELRVVDSPELVGIAGAPGRSARLHPEPAVAVLAHTLHCKSGGLRLTNSERPRRRSWRPGQRTAAECLVVALRANGYIGGSPETSGEGSAKK